MSLNRSLVFEVKGNSYRLTFPTVAQFIDIESTKAKLASDAYGDMLKAGTMLSIKALDYIDLTANLTILCPKLMEDLKADSILALDVFDAKELLKAYKEQYVPWMVQWQKVLAEVEDRPVVEDDLDADEQQTEKELESKS